MLRPSSLLWARAGMGDLSVQRYELFDLNATAYPPGPSSLWRRLGRWVSTPTTWTAASGRPPTADDDVGRELHLEALGFRRRRFHDLRRTFITLARVDGARADLLEMITHAPRGDIINIYTSMPWPSLCAEVEKLKIERRMGDVIALPWAAQAAGSSDSSVTASVTVSRNPTATTRIGVRAAGFEGDSALQNVAEPRGASQTESGTSVTSPPPPSSASEPVGALDCHTVTLALEEALRCLDAGRVDLARAVIEKARTKLAQGD